MLTGRPFLPEPGKKRECKHESKQDKKVIKGKQQSKGGYIDDM